MTDVARARAWISGCALAFALAAVTLPLVGPAPLDPARVWAREEPDWSILIHLRLSRTLLGLFGGAALGLAGRLFQSMLREALATPYTLGISAGASLGAVLAIWMDWQQVAGLPVIWVASLAGAAAVLAVVVGSALQQRRVSSFSLLSSPSRDALRVSACCSLSRMRRFCSSSARRRSSAD